MPDEVIRSVRLWEYSSEVRSSCVEDGCGLASGERVGRILEDSNVGEGGSWYADGLVCFVLQPQADPPLPEIRRYPDTPVVRAGQ